MITADNLFSALADIRFWVFQIPGGKWVLMESLPEEGDGVRKSIARLDTHEAADAKLKEKKEEFLNDLKARLKVVEVKLPKKRASVHCTQRREGSSNSEAERLEGSVLGERPGTSDL